MITYICPNCDNEVDLGDECDQCKPKNDNDRLRKITDILKRLLSINAHKKYLGHYCVPMYNGRFTDDCEGCAYFELTKEIDELKKEVEKEEE